MPVKYYDIVADELKEVTQEIWSRQERTLQLFAAALGPEPQKRALEIIEAKKEPSGFDWAAFANLRTDSKY